MIRGMQGQRGGICMRDRIVCRHAQIEDAPLIHQLMVEAFMTLYEKYHDEDTSPAKEGLDKVISKMQMKGNNYYLICMQNTDSDAVQETDRNVLQETDRDALQETDRNAVQVIGAVRVVENPKGVCRISPIFIVPEFQNAGIGSIVMNQIEAFYAHVVLWKLSTIEQEKRDCHFYEKCGYRQTGKKKNVQENMTLAWYEKYKLTIRRFREQDAHEVVSLIHRNFIEVNAADYGLEKMKLAAKMYDEEKLRKVASYAHMYVFCQEDRILAVGAISSYWGSEKESILLTIFVLPEYHQQGIGRLIMQTLRQDPLYLRAERIEIPASITAVPFYQKFGFAYKDGVQEMDGEGHFRLEKFRTVKR